MGFIIFLRNLIFSLFIFLIISFVCPHTGWCEFLVSCDWLKAHLKDPSIVIVDISKNPSSYEKGHIPGALKIYRHRDLEDYTTYPPVGYPQKRQFIRLMERLGITGSRTVVAYDDNRGIYASRMVFLLELFGHPREKIKMLNGGKKEWIRRRLPLEKRPGKPSFAGSYIFQERNPQFLSTWQEIYRKVVQKTDKKALLLDVRPKDEYDGTVERVARAGHIPGALNLEVAAIVTKPGSHVWKDNVSLKKLFVSKGITPDKHIFIYCHSGDRSAQAFVILKYLLGYEHVKIYEKAWVEWAVLQALPIVEPQ